MRHILLDASPLGLLSNPTQSPELLAISEWTEACILAGQRVYVPESADYEVRRELILAGKTRGIHRLNLLKQKFEYLPITTAAMLRAAELWAETRRIGQPTADPKRIDFDTILAAQAQILSAMSGEVVVATSTVGHLSRYVNAALWTELTP